MNIKAIWKGFFWGIIIGILCLAIFTFIFVHTDISEKIFEKISSILLFAIVCLSSMFVTVRVSQKRLFHGLAIALLWCLLFVIFNVLFPLGADITLKLVLCIAAGAIGSFAGAFFS